jgi:hypothetical protein
MIAYLDQVKIFTRTSKQKSTPLCFKLQNITTLSEIMKF